MCAPILALSAWECAAVAYLVGLIVVVTILGTIACFSRLK